MDRLNTKAMLQRRNYNVQPNNHCVMCHDQAIEDISHLFFDCPFALACWQKLGITWNNTNDTIARIVHGRASLGLPFFMEIFIIAAWEIWNLRNGKIFEGKPVNLQLWIVRFKDQVLLQLHRIREELRPLVLQWLSSVM